jgi:hypothetical protein
VDGRAVSATAMHLSCYKIKDAKVPVQPKFGGATLDASNVFDSEPNPVELKKPFMVCVPSQ